MPNTVAAASRLSGGPPACILLEEFASFQDRRNATTATALTTAGLTVQVSFELVDPPGISRWFVHSPGAGAGVEKQPGGFNGRPQILNAADALVVISMIFFPITGRGWCVFDYFVYRAGPGRPSLELVPGPCPGFLIRKQVGVVPHDGGGRRGHYSVVFPVWQTRRPYMVDFEIFVFSSASQAWSSRVARLSGDEETVYDDVVLHSPTKAVAAGGGSLAWIDLWRGVLLCTWPDDEEEAPPVLRLIQWPVPPPRFWNIEICSPLEVRNATLSGGVVRFVDLKLRHRGRSSYFASDASENGWKATVWRREVGSAHWDKCLKADTSNIFADSSVSSSGLLRKLWEDDAEEKPDLSRVITATPRLSLQDEDVVYIMAQLKSGGSKELLLAVNAREERAEAAVTVPLRLLAWSPYTFSSFFDTS